MLNLLIKKVIFYNNISNKLKKYDTSTSLSFKILKKINKNLKCHLK
jgi:hypothetical protein